MHRLAIFFLILSLCAPIFVRALTKAELLRSVDVFESRAEAIKVELMRAEAGTAPLPKSKEDILAELSAIEAEAERIKTQIADLPVIPSVTSVSPESVLPGSEVTIRGTGFKPGAGNYVNLNYGSGAGETLQIQSVTVSDPTTAHFTVPTTYSFLGTYGVTLTLEGIGRSNVANLQVRRPSAVGGETLAEGEHPVLNNVANRIGSVIVTKPVLLADSASGRPSAFIESIQPQNIRANDTITIRGVGLSVGANQTVEFIDSAGTVTSVSAVGIEGGNGTVLQVKVPGTFADGSYSLRVKSATYGESNSRAFSVSALAPQSGTADALTAGEGSGGTPLRLDAGRSEAVVRERTLTGNTSGVEARHTTVPPAGGGTVVSPGATGSSAGGVNSSTIFTFLVRVQGVMDTLVSFIVGLSVFVIMFGILRYLTAVADEEKRAEAKRFVVWGVAGVFGMLSLWGFVNIMVSTFALDRTIDARDVPTVPVIRGSS